MLVAAVLEAVVSGAIVSRAVVLVSTIARAIVSRAVVLVSTLARAIVSGAVVLGLLRGGVDVSSAMGGVCRWISGS